MRFRSDPLRSVACAFVLMLGTSVLGTGCSRQPDVPSLAPRPAEQARTDDGDLILPPPVEVAVDPQLAARLAGLIADTQTAISRFDATVAQNRTILQRGVGASPGSEAWLARQPVISLLYLDRQQANDGLNAVDEIVITEGQAAADDRSRRADFAAAQDAQAQIDAMLQKLSRTLAALESGGGS